jgi:hypothetical protein
MQVIRRFLGVLVMIAGILGLALSLAGLVSVWMFKPNVTGLIDNTILTLKDSVTTSQTAMEITGQALGATVDSIDALSSMLSNTATSVEETMPVFDQINVMMGETVPSTLEAATDSLKTAQEAAEVLDSAIKSLDNFRFVLSATPFLGAFVEQPDQPYDPEVPLADSLGELATNLESLPGTFTEMSVNLDNADDNLVAIQDNLIVMSNSVALISASLAEYKAMVGQSQGSLDNLTGMLANLQNNLATILNIAAWALTLFFVWLLAAQIVILSQGWELYQGTTDHMENGDVPPLVPDPASDA